MKKLITLLLVLTFIVCNSWGEKKRIYVQNSTGGDLYAYAWENNTGTELLGNWPGTKLVNTVSDTNVDNWYYVDVNLSDGAEGGFSLKFTNNAGKECNNISNAQDKYYKLWGTASWGVWGDITNCGSQSDLKYYIYNVTTASYSQEMSLATGDLKYTADIDNTAGANNEILVAPSFVTDNYMSSDTRWKLLIRPWSDYATLSFSNVSIDAAYAGISIWNNNSNSWKTNSIKAHFILTIDLVNSKYSIEPYFERTLPAAAEGFGTFSSEYDVIPDASLTSVQYASEINTSTGKITWADYPATGIKAGEGALLTGTAGTTYKFNPATSAVAPTTNYLRAIGSTYADAALPQTLDGKTNYILSKVNSFVGFHKVNDEGSWVNVGNAYLSVPTGGSFAREFFALDDEDVTAIEAVKQNVKVNGEYFDLLGRKVAQPAKGLYIVNGKKVVIK